MAVQPWRVSTRYVASGSTVCNRGPQSVGTMWALWLPQTLPGYMAAVVSRHTIMRRRWEVWACMDMSRVIRSMPSGTPARALSAWRPLVPIHQSQNRHSSPLLFYGPAPYLPCRVSVPLHSPGATEGDTAVGPALSGLTLSYTNFTAMFCDIDIGPPCSEQTGDALNACVQEEVRRR